MAHNNRAAVLGTGQTKYVAKRHDVTMAGMCREAIDAALDRIEATDAPWRRHFAVAGPSAAARICDPYELRKAARCKQEGISYSVRKPCLLD